MKRLLLLLPLLFLSVLSFAQVPKYLGYVSDHENIFTPEENKELTNLLMNYEKQQQLKLKF